MSVDNEISVPKLDPERTLELILDALGELIDYELAVVLGLEGEDRLRVRKAAGPLVNPRLRHYAIDLHTRRDIASIMERGETRLFGESEEHVDTYAAIMDLPHGHSCLVSPLICAGRRIGLLTLDHRSCGKFTPGLVRFVGTISKLISLSVAQSVQADELERANADLVRERNALFSPGYQPLAGLVGASPAWLKAIESLRLVAGTDMPVLVLGETGTGKEQVSRSVHQLSARAGGPFVALNCSALAASLAESELFGHEKGSFTGAATVHRGRFELADGGTLFLDEIGDLPLELQPKLLRVLQEGSFERVGGERAIRVDVRVVAATHVDLAAAVAAGRFRRDLFYRLTVFPVALPPLRERSGDVLLIAEAFLEAIRSRSGFTATQLSATAARGLETQQWPGNVRELRNAIERAAILARGGVIEPEHLTAGSGTAVTVVATGATAGGDGASPAVATLDDVQRRSIGEALKRCNGKIYGTDGAAALLGLKPSTLQSRIKKLGVERC